MEMPYGWQSMTQGECKCDLLCSGYGNDRTCEVSCKDKCEMAVEVCFYQFYIKIGICHFFLFSPYTLFTVTMIIILLKKFEKYQIMFRKLVRSMIRANAFLIVRQKKLAAVFPVPSHVIRINTILLLQLLPLLLPKILVAFAMKMRCVFLTATEILLVFAWMAMRGTGKIVTTLRLQRLLLQQQPPKKLFAQSAMKMPTVSQARTKEKRKAIMQHATAGGFKNRKNFI